MTRTGSTFTSVTVRRLASSAAAVALVAMAATGCAGSSVANPAPVDSSATAGAAAAPGRRIVLRFDQAVVPATLSDTAAGREFATLLPVTLELRDPMGQAKSGTLPVPLAATDDAPVTDPEAGGFYYVPGRDMVAVFYDDLGQTVPSPGLTLLGSVDGDLTEIAAAGNRVRVRIDLADATST